MLRLLRGAGWLPQAMLAAGELLHALPDEETAAYLVAVWRALQPALGEAWPLEAPGGKRGFMTAARQEPDEDMSPRAVRELVLSLLHNHVDSTGPQYSRFLALLSVDALLAPSSAMQS